MKMLFYTLYQASKSIVGCSIRCTLEFSIVNMKHMMSAKIWEIAKKLLWGDRVLLQQGIRHWYCLVFEHDPSGSQVAGSQHTQHHLNDLGHALLDFLKLPLRDRQTNQPLGSLIPTQCTQWIHSATLSSCMCMSAPATPAPRTHVKKYDNKLSFFFG